MSVYVKLTDAQGKYTIDVRFVQVKTGVVWGGAKIEADLKDRLLSSDIVIRFPPLPIPEEGRYEFQVYTNETYLGGAFLDAALRK